MYTVHNYIIMFFFCQLSRRIHKGAPDSLRGELWCRLLNLHRLKQEQIGVYEVTSHKPRHFNFIFNYLNSLLLVDSCFVVSKNSTQMWYSWR